jgi:hypothetical protein
MHVSMYTYIPTTHKVSILQCEILNLSLVASTKVDYQKLLITQRVSTVENFYALSAWPT